MLRSLRSLNTQLSLTIFVKWGGGGGQIYPHPQTLVCHLVLGHRIENSSRKCEPNLTWMRIMKGFPKKSGHVTPYDVILKWTQNLTKSGGKCNSII